MGTENLLELKDYLRVLRLRWKLVVACLLAGVIAAGLVVLIQKPIYESSSQLFVKATDGTLSGDYTSSTFANSLVQTDVQFVNSNEIASAVVNDLKLPDSPGAIAAEISSNAPLNTSLLNIDVKDASAARAQQIAVDVDSRFSKLVNSLEGGSPTLEAPIHLVVVRAPTIPSGPVTPRKKLDLGLGLIIGLIVGIGAAVLRQTLDVRVSTAEELADSFATTLLTSVGFDQNAKKSPLITDESPNSQRAEAFRRLRTNLQFVSVDERPRSIVITSSLPGEGKTTTACNLAIALAESGMDVVLVEGDLRRPRVADYMGIEGAVGLTSVLVGNVSVDEALQPWGRTGRLKVLPSGALPPNPSEVLGSNHMVSLIASLEERGLVVIDAPPLLPVTDGAVLATRVTGTIVVVKARSTRRDQLRAALLSLQAVKAHVYGGVYNMAPNKGPDAYAYGYGGYGTKYYNSGDEDKKSRGVMKEAVPVETTIDRGQGLPTVNLDRAQTEVKDTPAAPDAPSVSPEHAQSALERLRALAAGRSDDLS